MASSKPRPHVGLPEAVKRKDKAPKRETGTPPRPYGPAGSKKKGPPSVTRSELAAMKRCAAKQAFTEAVGQGSYCGQSSRAPFPTKVINPSGSCLPCNLWPP
jgi:hypothetical protein